MALMCVQVFVFLLNLVITAHTATSLAFCGRPHLRDILGLMDIKITAGAKNPLKVVMCFHSTLTDYVILGFTALEIQEIENK